MLTLPFIGMVLLTFVTLVALPCNLIALPLLGRLTGTRPQARTPLILLLVAAPWLLGGGVLISSVIDVLFGACDLGSICLWNEDPRLMSPWRVLIVVPLFAAVCNVVLSLGRNLLQSLFAVQALQRTGLYDEADDAIILPSPVPLAFAARGHVFVSQGLKSGLTPWQLKAVLVHERAHVQRSDGVCQVIARALSCTLVPPVRRRVLDALTLANEQSCDEAAGRVVGRLQTGQAILAAERLCSGTSGTVSPAFTESFVPDRVMCLMRPEPASWRGAKVYAYVICGLLSMFVIGDIIYYTSMILLYPSPP